MNANKQQLIEKAVQAQNLKRWEEALLHWEEVQKKFPGAKSCKFGRAFCLERSNVLDEAQLLYEDLLHRFPEDKRPYIGLARIKQKQADWEDAAKFWKLLGERFFEHQIYALSGQVRCLCKLKRYTEINELFKITCKKIDQPTALREIFCNTLPGLPKEEAVKLGRVFVDAFENDAEAYCCLGELELSVGETEKASLSFEHAISIDPRLIKAQAVLAEVAVRSQLIGFEKTTHLWLKLHSQFPDDHSYKLEAIDCLIESENWDDAKILLEKEIKNFTLTDLLSYYMRSVRFSHSKGCELSLRYIDMMLGFPDSRMRSLTIRKAFLQAVIVNDDRVIEHILNFAPDLLDDESFAKYGRYSAMYAEIKNLSSLDQDINCFEHEDPQTLVLFFRGIAFQVKANYIQLLAPLIEAAKKNRASVWYLFDQRRALYMEGLQGLGADYEATLAALKNKINVHPAKKLVCVSVSGGGIGAIRYGIRLGAQRILTFSSPTNLTLESLQDYGRRGAMVTKRLYQRVPQLATNLREDLIACQNPPLITSVYNAEMPQDAKQAGNISDLPYVMSIAIPDEKGHNSIEPARKAGILNPLIDWALTGKSPPSISDFDFK